MRPEMRDVCMTISGRFMLRTVSNGELIGDVPEPTHASSAASSVSLALPLPFLLSSFGMWRILEDWIWIQRCPRYFSGREYTIKESLSCNATSSRVRLLVDCPLPS